MRGATLAASACALTCLFQSTHPMRGATAKCTSTARFDQHFNPRTPCGVRLLHIHFTVGFVLISIHAPHAGCDPFPNTRYLEYDAISIHAPHAGCDVIVFSVWHPLPLISIHAPHAGCDRRLIDGKMQAALISIHAPHAGCDIAGMSNLVCLLLFQSTHPMRGATATSNNIQAFAQNFNPRTPCGVRHCMPDMRKAAGQISIHAPHAGCDQQTAAPMPDLSISIHAPHAGCDANLPTDSSVNSSISIHAPHAGCDLRPIYSTQKVAADFNPRTPCGVRLPLHSGVLPTVPYFNPRTPCGVRRFQLGIVAPAIAISIHAPHAGCDSHASVWSATRLISIHAPHAGCDRPPCRWWTLTARYFNPRTPCGVRQQNTTKSPCSTA